MATGVLGGNPTITKRTFQWTTNVTNFTYYTCPANTISYVTIDSYACSGALQLATVVSSTGYGWAGTFGTYRESFVNSANTVLTMANPNNTPIPIQNFVHWGSMGAHRIENPTTSIGTSPNIVLTGQFILMPSEFLWISTQNVAGGRTYELNYTTLEIQSGS